MKWPDWAPEGSVEALPTWFPEDGSAIICRNNAPLFSCALRLLQMGKGVKLVGSELGPSLIKTLKKLGPESMTQGEVLDAIDEWEEKRISEKAARAESIADKAECLRVFASFGDTLSAAIAYVAHIFAAAGPITLLSGHKSKGLEWPVVYHLDPWRVPSKWAISPEAKEQERNLRGVIETRAQRSLFLVDLKNLTDPKEVPKARTALDDLLDMELGFETDQSLPGSAAP